MKSIYLIKDREVFMRVGIKILEDMADKLYEHYHKEKK